MKNAVVYQAIVLALFCVVSCDESFNPSAAFEPRMVVYSVLSTAQDSQFVRIYSTYNPPDGDPENNAEEVSVTDARVQVIGLDEIRDSRTYEFQKTEIQRPGQSRYKSAIVAYFCYPFKPLGRCPYRLSVTSPTYGNLTADLTTPGKGLMKFVYPFVLEDPWKYPYDLQLSIRLSDVVDAFLVRLYIEYDLFDPVTELWKAYRTEVPVKAIEISKAMDVYEYVFPGIVPRQTPKNPASYLTNWDGFSFLPSGYQTVILRIVQHAHRSRFKRAVVYLVQIDEQLYRYYYSAHLYQDKNSIRLDEPQYTNIRGGIGLFGSLVIDSLDYPLPERICPPPIVSDICH